jgi:Flp pilus assembly protein CpaB
MTRTSPARRYVRDLGRAVSWHRRKLAVLAAVGAVLTGVTAAAPDGPPTITVVRATTRLDGGTTLSDSGVAVVRLPATAVPEDALTDVAAVVGRTLLGPVAKGSVLTELDLLTPKATRAGQVVAPLRLADPGVAALLRSGDRVDVLAAAPEGAEATVIARRVQVLTVPAPVAESGLGPGGSEEDALLLVEVDAATATRLAQAAVSAELSVVLR